ncbi:CotS family spore coat protein [Clostridium rectalis]|uniref:CotS family spore coat protein n=1 Tax=Clostridium rectalis TaxID=2040295 RepID=UPI000F63E16C|nr:CotS family spore coat protein [Clostridium rectalis]
MNEIFNDKLYLAEYDLDSSLFEKFNIEPYDLYPLRSIFVVNTDKGMKILKKIQYNEKELLFIYKALNYIRSKFDKVMSFTHTYDKKIYTNWENNMYCMIDLVDGRESDYNNPIDIKIASKGLSKLHSASIGFKTDLNHRNYSGKLLDNFKESIEEMKVFKNIASLHKNKDEFDSIFLDNIDYYIDEIKKSINILEDSSYYELCNENGKIAICHHDLAHHNIIINDEKEEAYFIDFDYSIVDLRVHDMCNFISKATKNFAYDIEKAKLILDEYNSENSLDKREIEVLYGMLTFPQDFYSISRDYYTKRKGWEEDIFVDKIKKKTECEEFRIAFLDKFEELI